MNLKLFATAFATMFVAELGDKTQLATLLYAADARNSKLVIFAASALSLVAGAGFIAIGLWTMSTAGGD